ncbi:hypothetical protein AU255_10125 [Methyloprofundus sedimenti]|uniref:DUF3617 domain-containing protein n=1 Tax=Methyloprofundus sedimenti TaxID=1420851 RepID=A0A1V8M9H8_9GAMM|nr:DUF3617 family protein [Methyloprofundus sedimenti]OQK18168.1 hypothetical protein AU255_10125 [Methyloprofundus sedimenti]
MMNKYLVTLLLTIFANTVFAEMPDIQEGLWEVTSVANIPAMPMKMPEVTMERCFTKQNMNPENILQQNNCQINKMDIQNNQAKWSMTCEQQGMTMQGAGDIQYHKNDFSGTFDMTMSGAPEGDMSIQTQITGRYIGVCPE